MQKLKRLLYKWEGGFYRHPSFQYAELVLLAFLSALNYEIFVFQNAFAPAGINGIATMVQYVFHFNLGYMSLIVNVPLLIFALTCLKKQYVCKTAVFVVLFSVALLLLGRVDLSRFVYTTANGTSKILAPIAAGTVNGYIYARLISMQASTGGTDIIAAVLRHKDPHISLVWTIFLLSAVVAAASYFVYGYKIEPVICCLLYCFLTSRVSDFILKGGQQALKVEIVTEHAEEISNAIIQKLRHSVTVLPAQGGYTHTASKLLVCIINKHQIVELQNILRGYDKTFSYVTTVSQTFGNFKKIHD